MSDQNLHIVTHESGWAVKREGHDDPISKHDTQRDAIESATQLAEAENNNMVIHRTDGRIRDVKSFEEAAAANNGTTGELRPASLGSRVRWGAVLAGGVVTMATSLALTVLGYALTLCLANVLSPDNLKVFVGSWTALVLLGSLFVGGLIISRLTVGESAVLEPSVYGVLLWGVMFILIPLLPASSADIGFGSMSQTSVATAELNENLQQAGMTDDQSETVTEMVSQTPSVSSIIANNATEIAWLTFAAIILSLGAAVGGAIVGATIQDPAYRAA